jgi:hypothetical protein
VFALIKEPVAPVWVDAKPVRTSIADFHVELIAAHGVPEGDEGGAGGIAEEALQGPRELRATLSADEVMAFDQASVLCEELGDVSHGARHP